MKALIVTASVMASARRLVAGIVTTSSTPSKMSAVAGRLLRPSVAVGPVGVPLWPKPLRSVATPPSSGRSSTRRPTVTKAVSRASAPAGSRARQTAGTTPTVRGAVKVTLGPVPVMVPAGVVHRSASASPSGSVAAQERVVVPVVSTTVGVAVTLVRRGARLETTPRATLALPVVPAASRTVQVTV